MNTTPREEVIPLTPIAYYILLALAEKPMYGYGIAQQCFVDAEGAIYFDNGSVYRTIKRLLHTGYISVAFEELGTSSPFQRRYYSLTATGRQVLEFECSRYRNLVSLGNYRLTKLAKQADLQP